MILGSLLRVKVENILKGGNLIRKSTCLEVILIFYENKILKKIYAKILNRSRYLEKRIWIPKKFIK